MREKVIYLSIPYTWYPQRSFEIANKVTAELMLDGFIVFSPISHSHPIADNMPLDKRTDNDFWLLQDLEMLRRCDEMIVVRIKSENGSGEQLIKQSKGCTAEIKYARELRLPITYYDYNG